MENERREVWNVDALLKRSRNTSYRENVLRRDKMVFTFFCENELIKTNPFDSDGNVKKNLVLYADDFTPEGLKLISWEDCSPEFEIPPVLKWHNYLDRGGKEDNIGILKKGLEQLKK